jgi:hypothetical protein
LLPLWAGQSANLSRCTDVRALLDTLRRDVITLARSLADDERSNFGWRVAR